MRTRNRNISILQNAVQKHAARVSKNGKRRCVKQIAAKIANFFAILKNTATTTLSSSNSNSATRNDKSIVFHQQQQQQQHYRSAFDTAPPKFPNVKETNQPTATTTKMSKPTESAAAAAADASSVMPLDLEMSNHVIYNCKTTAEKSAYEDFDDRISKPTIEYIEEHKLISVSAYLDADPEKKLLPPERIGIDLQPSNLVVMPKSVSVDTQPQKLKKIDNKVQKKPEFVTAEEGPLLLRSALERRFRSVVVMGDYMVIGGVVTYPGIDHMYDKIDDVGDFVRTARQSCNLDQLPNKSVGIEMEVDDKTFGKLAVIYINRGPDQEPVPRYAVPELCRVTVGYYMMKLQQRLKESQATDSEPAKKAQFAALINSYIMAISQWSDEHPEHDPKKTEILVYNYVVVTDNSIGKSPLFEFIDKQPEVRAERLEYIYTKNNAIMLNLHFKAKERPLFDKNFQPLPKLSDVDYLADKTLPVYVITCACKVPIIPAQRFEHWKKSAEGLAVMAAKPEKKKRRRSSSLSVATEDAAAAAPKRKSATSGALKKKGKKETKKEEEDDDDDDGDGNNDDANDDEEDGDNSATDEEEKEEEADEDEEEEEVETKSRSKSGSTKKKSKSAAVDDAEQPTKADIGSRGTAKDTAAKVKSAIANKSKTQQATAAAAATKDDESKSAQGSQSAESSHADDNDAVAATSSSKQKSSLPKSEAKRELEAIGAMKADIKSESVATAPEAATANGGTKTSGKKSRKTKRDDENDKDAAAAVDSNAMAKDEPSPTDDDAAATLQQPSKKSKFALSTAFADDSELSDFNYCALRRKVLSQLADFQQAFTDLPNPEDSWGPWAEAKNNDSVVNGEDEMPEKLAICLENVTATMAFVGLGKVFIDANTKIMALDNESVAAEEEKKRKAAEEAEAKRKAAEEAEAKRKAAEEEKKRKAAEEEKKRKAAEEAEAKRKAAEEAEAKRKAAEEAEAKRKAAEEEKKRKAAADAATKRASAVKEESAQASETTPSVASGSKMPVREPGESFAAFAARVKKFKEQK